MTTDGVLWSPPADVRERSRIGAYLRWLREHRGLEFADYDELWRWSVEDLTGFWGSIWEYFDVTATKSPTAVIENPAMPGARWFPGAALNYAEQRLTLAARWQPAEWLDVRFDIRLSRQRNDALRTSDRDAWLASLTIGSTSISPFALLGTVPAVALMLLGFASGSATVTIALVVVGVVIAVVAGVLGSAARAVFSVALYRFASGTGPTGPFTERDLDGAVARKGSGF